MGENTTVARRPRRPAVDDETDEVQDERPVSKAKPAKKSKKGEDKAKSDNGTIRYRCQFGGVSIGDATCRLGVKILRDVLKIAEADKYFCGRRLNCIVVMHRSDEDPDQQHLDGMDDMKLEIKAVCDVKRYAVGPKDISIGLSFNLVEVHIEELARYAKQQGTLTIVGVASLDELDKEDE